MRFSFRQMLRARLRQTVKSHFAGAESVCRRCSLQFDKSFLHDIPRPVAIAEDARGVLQEGQLEATQKRRQVIIGWDWFGHAHKHFTSSNPRPARLLKESSRHSRTDHHGGLKVSANANGGSRLLRKLCDGAIIAANGGHFQADYEDGENGRRRPSKTAGRRPRRKRGGLEPPRG